MSALRRKAELIRINYRAEFPVIIITSANYALAAVSGNRDVRSLE